MWAEFRQISCQCTTHVVSSPVAKTVLVPNCIPLSLSFTICVSISNLVFWVPIFFNEQAWIITFSVFFSFHIFSLAFISPNHSKLFLQTRSKGLWITQVITGNYSNDSISLVPNLFYSLSPRQNTIPDSWDWKEEKFILAPCFWGLSSCIVDWLFGTKGLVKKT